MRLLLPLSALGIAATASAAEAPGGASAMPARFEPPASRCPSTIQHFADREQWRLSPLRLGELPAADAYAAVYKRVDGCIEPVLVGKNIGRVR